jgi:MoaA/NifB/PqqE/SkfB family radical SAM enzyme
MNSKVCCRFSKKPGIATPSHILKTFIESDHLDRFLEQCDSCGALFFHEFYEVIDYSGGDDKCYCTDIHVEDEADADALAKLSPLSLLFQANDRPNHKW